MIIVSIVVVCIALVGMSMVSIKKRQLTKSYIKGGMYVDTYEFRKGKLQSHVPVWGTLLLIGLVMLGACLLSL